VEAVSWENAQEFCSKLSSRPDEQAVGWRYRLPTEAEWEYACRAGSTLRYGFDESGESLDAYAWYDKNSEKQTHPVGQKKPNAWGLYDMQGNVHEFCADWYDGSYYGQFAGQVAVDPAGPSASPVTSRVLRGCSWYMARTDCRSALRNWGGPRDRNLDGGFRVAAGRSVALPDKPPLDKRQPVKSQPEPHKAISPPPLTVAPFDNAQANRHQATSAKDLGMEVEITNSIGMKLVLIPAGEFLMGSPDLEEDAKPQHQVRITRPFYLGVFEVTQAEYERVIGLNPSHFRGAGGAAPVERVSWDDAQAFCVKLSALAEEQAAGRRYRLPTEAEWEYACRAGSTLRYGFDESEELLGDHAWYRSNAGSTTHPVGQKKPNAWGLYDMQGNAYEWCSDWYDATYYGQLVGKVAVDPAGPASALNRVLRGGNWNFHAYHCRMAFRGECSPELRDCGNGFRVAL
jgi:formylglycine-generating enzyme required for sulfatase activity